MNTARMRRICFAILLGGASVVAVPVNLSPRLSLQQMRQFWVEQLSAIGTELEISFKPPTGLVEYYRVNNGAERRFADKSAPAPLKLTISVTDRLALIGRHARLYYSALPDPVSAYGFTMREEVDGRNMTVTNHAFMVLVGTNGIARGIGENGVVIVPPKVEAVQKVLAEAGLIPAPESISGQKTLKRRKPVQGSTSTEPRVGKTKFAKSSETIPTPSPQTKAESSTSSGYLAIVALLLVLLGVVCWFLRRK